MKRLFLLLMLLASYGSDAQGQYNNWHFGRYRAMTFSGSTVIPNVGSVLWTDECVSTISDNAGNLLFYTVGWSVYNKNHMAMAACSNLGANGDAQQGVLIVPKPLSPNLYYVFTIGDTLAAAFNWGDKLYYSVVDMNLNSGLGDISVKTVRIDTMVSERMTATMHNNGQDIWVVTWNYNTNVFKSYLVSAAGINTTPVISYAGLPTGDFTGAIKISNSGTRLIATHRNQSPNHLELFNFNNSTGVVTGNSNITVAYPYGIEFSACGTKFYMGSNGVAPIYQFDMLAGNDAAILASKTAVSPTYNCTFSFQLAPDNKIYFVTCDDSLVGAINNPDVAGMGCNVNYSQIVFTDTSGNTSSLGNNFNLTYAGNCLPLGIRETNLKKSDLFYPNPVSSDLFVNAEEPVYEIKICSMNGEVLKEFSNEQGITSIRPDLPDGIYLIELLSRQGEARKKLVVMH